MKILFDPVACIPFHGKTLQEAPLGGTETLVIRMAEALDALGHDVIVLTKHENPPLSKPRYLPLASANTLGPMDVHIAVRGWRGLFDRKGAKINLLFATDSHTNPHTFGIGDKRVHQKIDGMLCVSEWQRSTLCERSGFPVEKSKVIRIGVKLSDFAGSEVRQRKRLIYASNPQRGLLHMASIYLELKKRHPELELHIFSNSSLYDMRWPPKVAIDMNAEAIIQLFQDIPGCIVHGTVIQKQLAREFMRSALWTYPCDIEETGCIVGLEAQAAGCVAVTSTLGGLPEVVGDAGILIEGNPLSDSYQKKFIEATDRLLTDDVLYQQLSEKALQRRLTTDWHGRALDLLNYLKEKHGVE